MPVDPLEVIQSRVLDEMERGHRLVRTAVIGAALLEGLLMIAALRLMDWRNHTHLLILVFSVLGYTIIVLGLVGLAGHVTRCVARVLAALDARPSR